MSWKPRLPFLNNEIEGPLLTYDQMSDNDLLSCTNSLATIIVVINHRNIPWGPRCLQRDGGKLWLGFRVNWAQRWKIIFSACFNLVDFSGCYTNCPLCDQEVETAAHLCLDCVFAQEVWHLMQVWSNNLVRRPERGGGVRALVDFFVAANPKSPAATRCSLAHVHNVEHLEGKK